MRRRTPILALATLLLPQVVAAQSAADIMNAAAKEYEARFKDIDNYTVVQSVNGATMTTYFEKKMQDGHVVFEPRMVGMPGMGQMGQMQGGDRYQRLRSGGSYAQFADRATLKGSEKVDGHDAWVIEVTDLSGLGMDDDPNFKAKSMTLFLGKDGYVPLQMKMAGEMTRNGQSHPVTMVTRMEDYRDTKGVLYPFRTTMKMDGMMDAMSDDERDAMSDQMKEMRDRLAKMPPEQRAMMEQQMKNMPGMRAMMEQMESAAASGTFEMTVEVQEVKVNEGPPSGS